MKVVLIPIILFVLISSAHSKTINVVTEELPPYNYTENGIIKGVSTEVVKKVLEIAGLSATFNSYPWKRAYSKALKKPDTLIYSIGRNPIRENKFKWVGVIAPVRIYFYKLKKNKDVSITSLSDAKDYKIGVVHEDYTTQFLISNNFKDLDAASSYTLNIRKLFEDRVDLILVDELILISIVKKESLTAPDYSLSAIEKVFFVDELSSGVYMAFSHNTDDAIVENCTKALEQIKQNSLFDSILRKYRHY